MISLLIPNTLRISRSWGKCPQVSPLHSLLFSISLKDRYFINDNDQIRQIANPEAEYQYKINRNDRFNVKQREAMNGMLGDSVPALLRNQCD